MSIDPIGSAEPNQLLCDLIAFSRKLSRVLSDVLGEEDIREDHWRTMRTLASPEDHFMGDLSEGLVMPAASLTRIVDELVDRGLVFRLQSDLDGRKISIRLSTLGVDKLQRLDALIASRRAELSGLCSMYGTRLAELQTALA